MLDIMASSETDAVCWRRAWSGVLEWFLGTEEGASWSQLMKIRRGDGELTAFSVGMWMIVGWFWWKGCYLRTGKNPPIRTLLLCESQYLNICQ